MVTISDRIVTVVSPKTPSYCGDGGLARNGNEPAGIPQRISLARLQTAVSTVGACRLGTGNQIADSLIHRLCVLRMSFLKPLLTLQHR
jgi:hypothetical protein